MDALASPWLHVHMNPLGNQRTGSHEI